MKRFATCIFDNNLSDLNRIAIIDHNGERATTWGELYSMSNKVANYIFNKGVSGVVPICMDRSVETVATILGFNLAGVGSTTFSTTTPIERIKDIELQTENKSFTQSDFISAMTLSEGTFVVSDNEINEALVFFTSGSTGRPKGVVQRDDAIISALKRISSKAFFNFSAEDIAMSVGNFSFVVIVDDIFAPLYAGCIVHIVPDNIKVDAKLLTKYINDHGVTKFFSAPQLLRNIGSVPSARLIMTGSDVVTNLGPNGYTLINGYGQTETIGVIFSYQIAKPMVKTPVGKPASDINYYILDDNNKICEQGELCVSGAIAVGYYKNPELTKEKFIINPFANVDGCDFLLRTGDIVKKLPDGNIMFLFRKDSMLKINGQRVEPGESEVLLKGYNGIKNVVVKGFNDENKSYMCAFFDSDRIIASEELKKYLSDFLPSYAIPTYFVQLESFPINENGKIDRASLKLPDNNAKSFTEYIEPTNEIEDKLCKAFASVLSVEKVGINDDFVQLGGDSISAMDVVLTADIDDLVVTDILSCRTPLEISKKLSTYSNIDYGDIKTNENCVSLTDSQMGIYLQCVSSPLSTMYNIPLYFKVNRNDKYTKEYIKNAIDSVIKLHPALYAHIEADEDKINMIRTAMPINGICCINDLHGDFDSVLKDFVQPFDLSCSPLCRVNAYLTETEVYILIDVHHIVADGTSCRILCTEICSALSSNTTNNEIIDSFSLSYIEERAKQSEKYNSSKEYFNNLLSGLDIDSTPLYDHKDSDELIHKAAVYKTCLSLNGLNTFLRNNKITENTFFVGVFGYTLAKFTNQTESVFAFAENGRNNPSLKNTVSMMVKTVPVYTKFDENNSAASFLPELQSQIYNSIDNDIYSFIDISKDIGINSDVMFVYQSDMLSDIDTELGHIKYELIQTDDAFSKFALSVYKNEDSFELNFQYRTDIYDASTVIRFAELFEKSSEAFINNLPLCRFNLIDDNDVQILNSFNCNELPYDLSNSFLKQFEKNVEEFGDRTALVYKDNKYSYSQVNSITNKIAKNLSSNGINKNDIVPVLINRNEYMVLASIGVLKCGAMYQPLDPSYPPERLNFMCKDTSAKIVIADRGLSSLLNDYNGTFLYIDEIEKLTDDVFNSINIDLANPFVLLYSSGTTGTPKGSVLNHGNILAMIHAYSNFANIDSSSKSAQFASFGFDSHLIEIFPLLFCGGTVYILPDDVRLDLQLTKEFCDLNEITILFMTTQVARQFATEIENVKSLKTVITGGETLSPFEPHYNYSFYNCYGPSECTVICTGFNVDKYYDNIPIGKSLPNYKLYVIDSFGRKVPIGVPGELVISGPQVGAGYFNRPDLTAQSFVANTFDEITNPPYNRCYKTGDVVRFSENGEILFVGRKDSQVKIRGFRIELSEVEGVIRSYPGISDATVVAKQTNNGKELNAYIVSDKKIDISDLNKYIKERKPKYMVPAATMQIDSIPLTPNMKVDRRKLPEIVRTSSSQNSERVELTVLEKKIFDILYNITGIKSTSVEDDLTELGITSITSIKLSVEIFKKFNVKVTSKDLLDNCTVLKLENTIISSLLEKSDDNTETVKTRLEYYPLTQSQMGIYLDCMSTGTDAYNIPALFKLPLNVDINKLKSAIKKAISAHESMLCTIHPDSKGDIAVFPKPDTNIDIFEETVDSIPPLNSHFEFNDSPLFKVRILLYNSEKYLFIEIHHIIADGESVNVLLDDIEKIYSNIDIESEKYTAFDLAVDEQALRNGVQYKDAEDYYKSVFRGVSNDYIPANDLFKESSFKSKDYLIDTDISQSNDFCKRTGISHNVFFTGAFAITLSKFTSHEDALFASIHNGRDDPRTSNLISMLVKTFPVYTQICDFNDIYSFYKNLDDRIRLLKKNDIYSFVDAAREFHINSDVMFIYQGGINPSFKLDGIEVERISTDFSTSKAELSLELYEENNSYRVHVEYNGGHYSDDFVDSFANAFSTCVNSILISNNISDIDITSQYAMEKYDVFNNTSWEVPYRPAYMIVEDSAKKYPNRTAVISQNGNLTYSQLNNMSNCLAKKIVDAGIPKQSVIEIIVDRTKEIYISQNGIMKSGCAFLCLSPEYPIDRISFVTNDSNASAIVTTHDVFLRRKDIFEANKLPVFFADDINTDVVSPNPNIYVGPNDLCYLIYTSGSTGKPKGVKLCNKGLINLVDNNPKNELVWRFLENSKVCTAVTSFTFDASLHEAYYALNYGITICLASDEEIHNPALYTKLCLDNNVTSIIGTPSLILNMLDYPEFSKVVKNLVSLSTGGESFPVSMGEKLRYYNPNIILLNVYGPTEATVISSYKFIDSFEHITIGKPIANTKIFIVDKFNHILPMGALGEMVVTGDCVGKGYINRDELSAKVFFKLNGESAYKTGDLALINHDCEIEYHGRIDNQVKLRGLRVELGEIENAINNCDFVKSSIVVVYGDEKNKYLAAYFTATKQVSKEDISRQIAKTLPEYMVPKVIIQLDSMPLTSNGKIDKKALPEPEIVKEKRVYVEPVTETEKTLCKVFEDVLGIEKVGTTDDFFELGGTSLTASKVAMFALSHDISIVYGDIFKYPTVKELARLVNNQNDDCISDELNDDFTNVNKALEGNVWKIGSDPGNVPLGNILLTGANGFLGMHILNYFLKNETGDVYCLLRKGNASSMEARLLGMYIYYFDESIESLINTRIHCIDGDITDKELVRKLNAIPFDTLINCAACVKHFANNDVLNQVNVVGVENLTNLCLENNKKLVHISTVSVAGEGIDGSPSPDKLLHENELYFNQILDNDYIISKFNSEKVVLEAVYKGLDAKIMRAGNLMPRRSDGEFQINYSTNGFMRRLHGYYALGCVPYSALSSEFEFSPIDETAGAMLTLAKSVKGYNVFHANNTHRVFLADVIRSMNDVGLKVEVVDEEEFSLRLKKALENTESNQAVSGLIAYLNRDVSTNRYMIGYDNAFSRSILNRMGYYWHITDDDYLKTALKQLKDIGFFDFNF